ncbi:unnamed protein product [Meganyctiphanes norvegica]|uniref:Ileal sodium/bile acid cotransporter n=1 Tax=Meganyctiphanes norvegica TaxID=48144 RepID=A0AAV2R047_MEGNR
MEIEATLSPLNSSSFVRSINVTEVQEPWKAVIDQIATIIMTLNVINFMLGMGCATYWREVWVHMRRPIGCAIGMTGQFILLPAVSFGLAVLFKLKTYEALGALMISCSPGGAFSNFFTFNVDGDLALSIVMTTFSSILAFVGMPFNLWLYSKHWMGDEDQPLVIPYTSILSSLAFVTLPVGIGMGIRSFRENWASKIVKISSLLGWVGVCVVFVLWLIIYWPVFLQATPMIAVGAILLPILGFSFAYALAKITCQSHQVARTIGVETGCQNMAVAISIIILSFHDPQEKAQIIIFPTLYGITLLVLMFGGIFLWKLYKKRCGKPDEDMPMTHQATIEKGTVAEKAHLQT